MSVNRSAFKNTIVNQWQDILPAIVLLLALSLMTACNNTRSDEASSGDIPIVDTHIHLYDLDRLPGLPWPETTDKVLYRSVLADEYNAVMDKNKVTGVIVVEASPRVSDNDWVLFHTEKYKDRYVGLIGALEFDKKRFKDDLDRLCKNERFVGLRIGTQYLGEPPKPGYMRNPIVLANIKHLSEAGKVLDVLLTDITLDDVMYIAQQNPQLKIVINNIDKVITEGKDRGSEPQEKIANVASYPNVYCKVTSLVHKCAILPLPEESNYFKTHLTIVLNAFGEDRLIYGSNWPCIIKDGEFSDHFNEINNYFAPKGRQVLEKLFYKNAEEVYGFKLR